MTTEKSYGTDDGFSLIEVLCAFVIVSASAGVAFEAVRLSTKSIASAVEKTKVLNLVPRIQLDLSQRPISGSKFTGEAEGLHWEAELVETGDLGADDLRPWHLKILPRTGKVPYDFLVSRMAPK